MPKLIEIEGLKTQFYTSAGTVKAVDGITYDVNEGETVAIVGESGCGKSVSAMSILRLIPDPPGKIVEGSIRFQGRDLLQLSEEEMRDIRGKDIGMVFQEPMTSLNPVLTIGRQLRRPWKNILASPEKRQMQGRSSCLAWSVSPSRTDASFSIRIISAAGCASVS